MTTVGRPWLKGDPSLCHTVTVRLATDMFGDIVADGVIPAGVVIANIDDTGTYGPWDRSAKDGRDHAIGLIFTPVGLAETTTAELWSGFGIVRGQVFAQRLPIREGPGALDYIAADQLAAIDFHNVN